MGLVDSMLSPIVIQFNELFSSLDILKISYECYTSHFSFTSECSTQLVRLLEKKMSIRGFTLIDPATHGLASSLADLPSLPRPHMDRRVE